MGVSAAIVGAVVGVGTTIMQTKQQRKQEKRLERAQTQQQKVETGLAAIQDRKARVKVLKEAQQAQAAIEAQAAFAGGQTSMSSGALASLNTNQAISLGDFQQSSTLQQMSTFNQGVAARAQQKAQDHAAYAQLGMYAFEQLGGWQTIIGPGSGTKKT